MSRTYKRPYSKSKRFDRSCRSHGSCPWCERNRTIGRVKRELQADEEIREFRKGA